MTSPSTTKTKQRVIALIAAAGQGTRLGAEVPKAYVELRGRTLLERSVRALLASGVVDEIIVLVSPDMEAEAARIIGRIDAVGATDAASAAPIRLVHGGSERADSVWAGLQAIPDEDAVVLIHDAARALTPPAMVRGVAKRVLEGAPAAVPVVPVADTIKEVADEAVLSTPDRSRLCKPRRPSACPRCARPTSIIGPSSPNLPPRMTPASWNGTASAWQPCRAIPWLSRSPRPSISPWPTP